MTPTYLPPISLICWEIDVQSTNALLCYVPEDCPPLLTLLSFVLVTLPGLTLLLLCFRKRKKPIPIHPSKQPMIGNITFLSQYVTCTRLITTSSDLHLARHPHNICKHSHSQRTNHALRSRTGTWLSLQPSSKYGNKSAIGMLYR